MCLATANMPPSTSSVVTMSGEHANAAQCILEPIAKLCIHVGDDVRTSSKAVSTSTKVPVSTSEVRMKRKRPGSDCTEMELEMELLHYSVHSIQNQVQQVEQGVSELRGLIHQLAAHKRRRRQRSSSSSRVCASGSARLRASSALAPSATALEMMDSVMLHSDDDRVEKHTRGTTSLVAARAAVAVRC